MKLQDDSAKLTDVGVQDGSCISLIMLPPFELYVQGTDQTMHTVVVPSSEPEVYTIDCQTSNKLILRKNVVELAPSCLRFTRKSVRGYFIVPFHAESA